MNCGSSASASVVVALASSTSRVSFGSSGVASPIFSKSVLSVSLSSGSSSAESVEEVEEALGSFASLKTMTSAGSSSMQFPFSSARYPSGTVS